MTTTLTFLSFEEWKKRNRDIEEEDGNEKCELCDGKGSHRCECGDEHDCQECGGTGLYLGDGVSFMSLYLEQKKKDQALLNNWLRVPKEGQR